MCGERARMGRDSISSLDSVTDIQFQSTRPYGARRSFLESLSGSLGFQSTRPYGARRRVVCGCLSNWLFQSTRPYGARRRPELDKGLVSEVSIHAPVWGATIVYSNFARSFLFQSTRPYGARLPPPMGS